MYDNSFHITASANTTPETYYRDIYDFERKMKLETEETFEFNIKIKGKNIFWFLYLTDPMSDNWGVCCMIGEYTIINISRKTKWWKNILKTKKKQN